MEKAHQVLKDVFGFDSFKLSQENVISRLLVDDENALVVFPTGGGKSLTYQIPALCLDGLTLVVSPLLALMKDQVDALVGRGVKAANLDSTLSLSQTNFVKEEILSGSLKMLYVAPERLNNEGFINMMSRVNISLLAVDEAHCISQSPMISVNLFALREKASSALLSSVQRPSIVYVTLQKHAEEVATFLRPHGIDAAIYHGGMPNEQRAQVQKDFMASADGIVVCTIAFGMGIDKDKSVSVHHRDSADTTSFQVVHLYMPKTLENYSQEVGRAGRDGLLSDCVMFLSPPDMPILEGFCRGDTCSIRDLQLWLQEVALKEPSKDGTVDFNHYKQAKEYDMRANILGLSYAQLELEYGFLRAITPFFSVYELTPLGNGWASILTNRSKVAIAIRSHCRLKGTTGKYEIDVPDAAAAAELDTVDLTKQITSWELDVLKALPKQTDEIKKMAENFHSGMIKREEEGVEKIRQVIEFATDDDCLAHNLAKYFGDDTAVPDGMCGRCTFCTTGQSVEFTGRVVAPVDHNHIQAILQACPARDDPRLLARMAFGITSPRLTFNKWSTSHPLFGSMASMDFNDLVAAFDVECKKGGYRNLEEPAAPTPKKRPAQPEPVNLPALQNAGRVLQDRIAKDATIIPDLGDTLTSNLAASGQVSGSYTIYPNDYRAPFQKRKFVPIPEGLFEHFDAVSGVTHVGLLPEIERAWISYDHKLFFWDYVDGHETSSFWEDRGDVIADVRLVKPKKGMFVDEITSLLVVTTPLSVIILGVSFESPRGRGDRAFRDLKLYATDLKVNTDVEMISVTGTSDGRIFMCGAQDGCLYELHYQENESWFAKRIQMINHSVGGVQSLLPRFTVLSEKDKIFLLAVDNGRNCFYALTGNSVSIYQTNGEKAVQHVQTITNLMKSAQDKAAGHPVLTGDKFELRSLHVVDPAESRSGIQFFIMTKNGVRLYFGPTNMPSYSYGPSTSTGYSRPLQLLHVRLPPTNLVHPDALTQKAKPPPTLYGVPQPQAQAPPRPFHTFDFLWTGYFRGMTVASHPGDRDGNDYILCMSPDLTRIGSIGQVNLPPQPAPTLPQSELYRNALGDRLALTEYATLTCIPGKTWATGSIPPSTSAADTPDGPAPSALNELATQFGEAPSQFMLFTNCGVSFLVKRRAVDFLRADLEELQLQGNVQPLVEFRDSFGRDQTCCMLLGLASGNTFLDVQDESTTKTGTIATPRPDITAVAKQAFYDLGERPTWTERVTYGTTDNQGISVFSGRREGLALYFARLIRPLWKAKLTQPGVAGRLKLRIAEDVIVTVQNNLFLLRDFLNKNPHLFHSSPSESSSRVPVAEQEAWRAEQNSVSEILTLLGRTIEALSFVLLLNDYMLGDLISQCDADIQQLIATQTFESLITSQDGMTISRALVNVIIDKQIGQQISAKENVRKAVESRNPLERQNRLAESLRYSVFHSMVPSPLTVTRRLFAKGARILAFEKLREICGDYQRLDYARGAVELPLACAQASDSDNIGLEAWHAGLPASDPRTSFAERRLRCYDLVLDSLTVFENKCTPAKKSAEQDALHLQSDPEAVRSHAYELAFASEDEVFHSTLYDWLIDRGLADDLLEMRPTFLEAHLRRDPVTVQKSQLLWQFYVKNGQSLRAAEVLVGMAESTQFELELPARLEYLTLAVGNAKSHPISATGQHETAIGFLTSLEEKVEVAQVQLEIYNVLLPHIGDAPEVGERINQLSKQLFTMTQLYTQYAVPFDLVDMKLLCLHVSEHRDETVVRPIWNQIFDEILREEADPSVTADLIQGRVVPLGKRFYPSESAFPLRFIATLLVRFTLANKNVVAYGWAPRILIQCGVPFTDVWDVFHEMYESQVPPFNDQANVQAISSDIAMLLSDWMKEVSRPQSSSGRGEFPVGRIDLAIDQYLGELEAGRAETRSLYESIRRDLRRNW
ncbi:hypothetical protein DXG01_000275 [Tephrocybe rancida]|nr:hypothetical protein DXG01_000275 [Tephrocybe rancida]